MTYTFDNTGKTLTITQEGVTQPADYTFDNVNEFVHATDTQYEDLEGLCLGMAAHIEKLQAALQLAVKQLEADINHHLPPYNPAYVVKQAKAALEVPDDSCH